MALNVPHSSNEENIMKNIFSTVILSTIFFQCSAMAEIKALSARAPDGGVSDDYLVALGTNAVPFLIQRLEDLGNEKNYEGLIHRLNKQLVEEGEDERICEALKKFIETHSKRDQTIPFDTISAMRRALGGIGMCGGSDGVEYLIEWLKTDKYTKKVRCIYEGGALQTTIFLLREGATIGLGYSGHPKALKVLEELRADPLGKELSLIIPSAVRNNKEVQKIGIRKFWEDQAKPKKHKKGDPVP